MSALNRWVYRVSDGQILMGYGFDPSLYLTDQVAYALVDLPDTQPPPDPRTQRAAGPTTLRVATAPEIAAYDATVRTARFQGAADDKDRLAMIALVVRAKNETAWAGMTAAQKKTAVRNEATVWRNLRDFIEDNL